MEIDRKTIKALSADTRLNILKLLKERRKLPSELSKELNLAPSTVVEHLKKLEESNLISKEERGGKWIYYCLTEKGKSLVQPKPSMQFVLLLALGLIMVIGGSLNLTSVQFVPLKSAGQTAVAGAAAETSPQGLLATAYEINWLAVLVIIIGIALIAYSLFRRRYSGRS